MSDQPILISESDDLAELMELGQAYADGARWVAYNFNRSEPEYRATEAQAVKARLEVHGARNIQDEIYCGGSGEGIERITDQIAFILQGSNHVDEAKKKALRGLGLALVALAKK